MSKMVQSHSQLLQHNVDMEEITCITCQIVEPVPAQNFRVSIPIFRMGLSETHACTTVLIKTRNLP